MEYTRYTAEDFALDPRFQQWVREPNSESELFWQQWLKLHPDKAEEIQEARQMVALVNFRDNAATQEEQTEVWNRIRATRQRNQPFQPTRSSRTMPLHRKWQGWAAAVVGIAMLGSLLYYANLLTTSRYATEYGQTQTIVLPDGSTVILNANSTLSLADEWDEAHPREVWLEGEAFFKVQKKSNPAISTTNQPGNARFIVHTNSLNVEVLGTQFDVSTRSEYTKVVLNSGKVKLDLHQQHAGSSILMAPGDLVEVSSAQKQPLKRKVKPELHSDWTNQQWILNNTSLQEVKSRLEETFGLEVTFASPDIARERMTGIVSTESLDDLIDALSTTNGLRMTKEGNQLFISR